MDTNTPEIIGGYVQSWEPGIYELSPLPDWVLEVVPAEEAGEASPLLYAEDLANEDVRIALNALADSAVRSEDGKDVVVTYDISLIDAGLLTTVLRGAEQIRSNRNLPQEIRRPAIDIQKIIRNGMSPHKAAEETLAAAEQPVKRSRADRYLESKKQREDEQLAHEAERSAEIEIITDLQAEHPPEGLNFFISIGQEELSTKIKPSGGILIIESDRYKSSVASYIRKMVNSPDIIPIEIRDDQKLRDHLANNNLSTLIDLYTHFWTEFSAQWLQASYEPGRIRPMYEQWLGIFVGFSDDYKESLRHDTDDPHLMGDGESEEAKLHAFGVHLLFNSLRLHADDDPQEFVHTLHDITKTAFDSGDEFVLLNLMNIVATVLSKSEGAAAGLMNAPIADQLDNTTRLKALDFMMALRETPVYDKPGGYVQDLSKRFKKYDTAARISRELKIKRSNKSKTFSNRELYQRTAGPLIERIEAGELADSLYLGVKSRKESLPQDA